MCSTLKPVRKIHSVKFVKLKLASVFRLVDRANTVEPKRAINGSRMRNKCG